MHAAEAQSFSETSILTRAIRRNIPDDGILPEFIGLAHIAENRYAHEILVRKPDERRQLQKLVYRLKNNNNMNLK
jgi:hypothetical protein